MVNGQIGKGPNARGQNRKGRNGRGQSGMIPPTKIKIKLKIEVIVHLAIVHIMNSFLGKKIRCISSTAHANKYQLQCQMQKFQFILQ